MTISDAFGIAAVSIAFVVVLFAGCGIAAVIGSNDKDEDEGSENEADT